MRPDLMPDYVGYDCFYLGGDPRLDERGSAEVTLQEDCLRIAVRPEGKSEQILYIPAKSITRYSMRNSDSEWSKRRWRKSC